MAIAHDFDYVRAETLQQALELKAQYGAKCLVLAGGTDLVVNIKEGMMKPEKLIDIKDIPELGILKLEQGALTLGAAVTFAQLINNPEIAAQFPILHDAAKTVASTGVRSRATLAGNICSAVPSLDSGPALFIYDGEVHCSSSIGARSVPIAEWFLAPRKTALREDELVTAITIKVPASKNGGIYLKLGRYGGEDLAQAGWGIQVGQDMNYRIAHCALAPVPARALLIEQLLVGKELSPELIEQAVKLIPQEINPITDIRSSKEYRLHLSGVMLKRGLYAARERMQGKAVNPQTLLGGLA